MATYTVKTVKEYLNPDATEEEIAALGDKKRAAFVFKEPTREIVLLMSKALQLEGKKDTDLDTSLEEHIKSRILYVEGIELACNDKFYTPEASDWDNWPVELRKDAINAYIRATGKVFFPKGTEEKNESSEPSPDTDGSQSSSLN